MERYEHQQHATWMYWLAIVLIGSFMLIAHAQPAASLGLTIATVAIAASFLIGSRMRTSVDGDEVRWAFGWGWPGASIPLVQIASVEIVQTNLLEGWGIHWTIWHGWVWNISGFQAVQLTRSDGSRVTLGTDDPEGLYDAIVANRRTLS